MRISIDQIEQARERLKNVITKTPLQLSKRLSELYGATVYLKREDLQEVRSFKIRGAYNKMSTLTIKEKKRGVVAASAGNHAQGVALSCSLLKIHGVIFMPNTTPFQKIDRVKYFGGAFVRIELMGNTYDEASIIAHAFCDKQKTVYVHPFDDPLTIAGQGTIGAEIYEDLFSGHYPGSEKQLDVIVAGIGGGGLVSGISSYIKQKIPKVKIIGAEPTGSPSMVEAIKTGHPIKIEKINTFVDGAAVQMAGKLTWQICRDNVEKIVLVPEGKVCTTMIELYQNEGIIAEPAGALSVSALDFNKEQIKGKIVVCILSGGNNDILRYPEVMKKSLAYQSAGN